MLEGNGSAQVISLLLAIFMVYSFFLYFNIFFERKKKSSCMVTGITIFIMWQAAIPEILSVLPIAWNIGVTVGATLVVVSTVYEGKFWKRCFFALYLILSGCFWKHWSMPFLCFTMNPLRLPRVLDRLLQKCYFL